MEKEKSVSIVNLIDALDEWTKAIVPGEDLPTESTEDLWKRTHDLLAVATTQCRNTSGAIAAVTLALREWTEDSPLQESARDAFVWFEGIKDKC